MYQIVIQILQGSAVTQSTNRARRGNSILQCICSKFVKVDRHVDTVIATIKRLTF